MKSFLSQLGVLLSAAGKAGYCYRSLNTVVLLSVHCLPPSLFYCYLAISDCSRHDTVVLLSVRRVCRRATVPGAGNCTSVPDAKNMPSRQAGNCTGSNKQVTDPASERDVDLRFQAFREGLGFEGLGGDARSGNF